MKKIYLFNPKNVKKSFDVYINKNPENTISIKYKTIQDVKNTISKLERLYRSKEYTHKRIWQVAMIMKVRLGVINKYKNTKYKKVKDIEQRYNLANRYYNFLKQRTSMKTFYERKKIKFKY